MPKLKRASSSLLSSQAKKRKKKQRERDRCALPCSEETVNSRRQRDTAACRLVREENPERRLLEQERDTAAHQ